MSFNILSIQSHIAYGYVGNKIATFAMQKFGNEVININTLQFSNHSGYPQHYGKVFSSKHIADIIKGLKKNGVFYKIDAVISGYIGSSNIGKVILETVLELKKYNEKLIYCCDPVIGDTDTGTYVNEHVHKFIQNQLVQVADIITPNQYEASQIAGSNIKTFEDVQNVAKKLYS